MDEHLHTITACCDSIGCLVTRWGGPTRARTLVPAGASPEGLECVLLLEVDGLNTRQLGLYSTSNSINRPNSWQQQQQPKATATRWQQQPVTATNSHSHVECVAATAPLSLGVRSVAVT